MKVRNFEQNRVRRLRDLAVPPAHDARDCHRAIAVADHEHVRVEIAVDPVEGGQAFAGASAAGADLGAAYEVVVEGVEGLARLQHHVVGDVNDVVDGAHARPHEALLHPGGRGAHLDPFNDAGREAPAEVGGLDGHGDELAGAAAGLGVGAGWLTQGLARDRGHLAGEAKDAKQVGAVGPRRDIEHDIADGIHQRRTDGGVLGQHEDALVLVAEAQLLLAQDHAGRVDAADGAQFQLGELPGMPIDEHRPFSGEGDLLAGGDVGRATDDHPGPLAGVDGSEAEAVGVGVGLDAENLGHSHQLGLPLLADDLPALDLGDGIGHAAGELLGGEVDVDVVAQPGERKLHETTLSPSHQQPTANSQQPF